MMTRQTHTVALLQLSKAAYTEIADKLKAAGYDHAFSETDGVAFIDMTGIGVTAQEPDPVAGHYPLKMAGEGIRFTINGVESAQEHPFEVSYDDVLERIGVKRGRVLSMVYHKPDGRQGSILPGETLVITDGTIINAADTSGA
jgi:hypothetical protein